MSDFNKNLRNVLNSEELEKVNGGTQIESVGGGTQINSEIMIKTGEKLIELYKIASQMDGMTPEQKEAYLKSIGKA